MTDAAGWSKRAAHAVVTQTTNNVVSLYLLTGYEESTTTFTAKNDVWFSNDLGNSWIIRGIAPFPPRGDAGVVVTAQGNLLVVGGFGHSATSSYTYFNDVWMSSTDVMTWTQMTAAAAWKHRLGSVVEMFGSSLVVIGGDSGWRDNKNNDGRSTSLMKIFSSTRSLRLLAVISLALRGDLFLPFVLPLLA